MKAAIFDRQSGRINRIALVPVGHATLNCSDGEDWMLADQEGDATHYVDVATMTFVAIPSAPSPSHEWDWTTKRWVANIEAARQARKREAEQERERRNLLPIAYAGTLFDADERGQRNVSAWQTQLAAGAALPDGFFWRDYGNVDHPAGADFINGLGAAITLRGTLLYQAAWQHKAAIDALTDVDAILTYDIGANWPP